MSRRLGDHSMLWGLGIVAFFWVLNTFFDFNIPIIRTLIGASFIYFGISILSNVNFSLLRKQKATSEVKFSQYSPYEHKKSEANHSTEDSPTEEENSNLTDSNAVKFTHSIVLTERLIDLTSHKKQTEPVTIELNVVLAKVDVLLPENSSIRTESNSVLAHVHVPPSVTSQNTETIEFNFIINTVLGSVNVKRKAQQQKLSDQ